MVTLDRWQWSLQTKGDGNGLICEGSVRVRESDLKKKERENMGWIYEKREKKLNKILRGEKKLNKKIKNTYAILFRTMPKLSWYCSMLQNFNTFGTLHEAWIVVFGMSNAKYLSFDTPDSSALTKEKCYIHNIFTTNLKWSYWLLWVGKKVI